MFTSDLSKVDEILQLRSVWFRSIESAFLFSVQPVISFCAKECLFQIIPFAFMEILSQFELLIYGIDFDVISSGTRTVA